MLITHLSYIILNEMNNLKMSSKLNQNEFIRHVLYNLIHKAVMVVESLLFNNCITLTHILLAPRCEITQFIHSGNRFTPPTLLAQGETRCHECINPK